MNSQASVAAARRLLPALLAAGSGDASFTLEDPHAAAKQAASPADRFLSVDGVSKRYHGPAGELLVLDDINLSVERGELVSVVGASGCGKTTLMRLIAGLESDYEGTISVNGRRISGPGINRGVVFQEPRLLPWLTVEQNVAFGLKGKTQKETRAITREHLELVGLKGFETFHPAQLSGGMAQRAAIARALVNRPEILLLDEPLGALDALTRLRMQLELEKIWRAEKIAMILITHDVEEAIYLGDRAVIMSAKPGRIDRIVPIPLPRPRNRESREFVRIKDEILREFNLK